MTALFSENSDLTLNEIVEGNVDYRVRMNIFAVIFLLQLLTIPQAQ
jgi:hypothetical protein